MRQQVIEQDLCAKVLRALAELRGQRFNCARWMQRNAPRSTHGHIKRLTRLHFCVGHILKLCKRSRKFATARLTVRDQFLKKFFALRTAPRKRGDGIQKMFSPRAWTCLLGGGEIRVAPRAAKRVGFNRGQIRLIFIDFQR